MTPDVPSPPEVTRRGPLFWVTALIGGAGIAWGVRGLFAHHIDTRPANWAKFFVGGVILHDVVFAPLVLGAGYAVARLVPARARAHVQAGLIVVGCLALFSWPEVRDYARVNHNPTSLPYNYTANLGAVAAAVVVAVVVAAVGGWLLRRRSRPS
ncbi:hypothetical protein K6U06_11400 [Acidiferrimicrobium sp. IK]|uniref:hypothetical protein n=1 Tax=Acidiferrimicrobium sp. IK TaxID=2871700 RepID=UPI0021CB469E|nr:hypothetical protein [Acidiferrimicrobium sp. IK]MCU4184968.1 hypothetical protein [Acidiferrimicrobium sp. IK]